MDEQWDEPGENATGSSESTGFERTQTFSAEGPLDLDIALGAGSVKIELGEGDPFVRVRHDKHDKTAPGSPPWGDLPWGQSPLKNTPWGNSGPATAIMDWVNDFLGQGTPVDAETVVRETRIEQDGNRLVVHAPKTMPHRGAALLITVHAPEGSHLRVRTHAADVSVTGAAGRVDVSSHSGDLTLDAADGAATVRTSSGRVRLGPVRSGLHLRSSSGGTEVTSLSGSATVATSSGDLWVGELSGDVKARTSSGSLTVADAYEGSVEVITGSGDIRVGVREGVAAEVDLSSGGGRVSSELDVADAPPENEVTLHVKAGSGAGDVVVTPATAVPAS